MASDRFQFLHAGIDELLRSGEVRAIIQGRAEDAKRNAESRGVMVERGAERVPMPYEVAVSVVGDRVSALLIAAHPAGLAAEAKYGTLAGSV